MSFYSFEGSYAQDGLLPKDMRDAAQHAGAPSLEGGGEGHFLFFGQAVSSRPPGLAPKGRWVEVLVLGKAYVGKILEELKSELTSTKASPL